MLGEFSNKIAVVTGGSRGIGREIALELASSGAQTVIVSSSADNLAGAAKIIAAAGPAPFIIAADLRALEGCEKVFDSVRDKFNRCDILVCSAGATRAGNFTELPDEAWATDMH
jgi:3-oxoacyl-[acyl-carrier protein] reductase